jgi:transcription-repair coupling factor (superfamily II helicase)
MPGAVKTVVHMGFLPSMPDFEPGFKSRFGGLPGASFHLAALELAEAADRPVLLICESATDAEQQYLTLSALIHTLPVYRFPDWEILPYDLFSPDQNIVSERLSVLRTLPSLTKGLVICSIQALLHRLPPVGWLAGQALSLSTGQILDPEAFRSTLEKAGYRHTGTVYEHGEYAIRGAVIDMFPMGLDTPVRIDLFDDEIDSLRTFDPDTQRTLERLKGLDLLPAREFPLTDTGIRRFTSAFKDLFDVDLKACALYQDVRRGIASPGIEYYLPLFFEDCDSLFDYFQTRPVLLTRGNLQAWPAAVYRQFSDRYEQRQHDPRHPVLPPARLLLAEDIFFGILKTLPGFELYPDDQPGRLPASHRPLPDLKSQATAQAPCAGLAGLLDAHPAPCLIAAETRGRVAVLEDLLSRSRLSPSLIETRDVARWLEACRQRPDEPALGICVLPLSAGAQLSTGTYIVAESDLLRIQPQQRSALQRRARASDQVFKSLAELNEGAAVVHLDHGVGRYLGLVQLVAGGDTGEFLLLEYASGARLYVPVTDLHLISRYAGMDPDRAPLDTLGSDSWSKTREKAGKRIQDVAAELLHAQAERQRRPGTAFHLDVAEYERFAAGFPFQETPDQATAIEAVIDDLCRPAPMDRLVCGDVGFGKTEVAMRAAFVTVTNGAQVCVLAPTTLLAQQHYENFRDRFADWPVNIEVLSRFRTGKESREILTRALAGKVDILIGTHRLLQKDVSLKSLGLLIIDEEHRFGVRQKEQLRRLRAEVDILTLTATPIPRTLNMAMQGMRDLSIISTPPVSRLAVRTFVRPWDRNQVREAILREILRGGQVYVVHNEVRNIEDYARRLQSLVPEATIAIGHGQMPERSLELVMSAFQRRQFNVLVCTTIIETGIDIPNANTILIERADKFGLAQLHQLRGRVGRSHHQAYCFLLTPPSESMTEDAHKRLDAIAATQDLGAGFALASHDLEIRGAGELLGAEQSGQIESIGFTLYMDMLNQTMEALRRGESLDFEDIGGNRSEVDLGVPALLPGDYLPDVPQRLMLYKRISGCKHDDSLMRVKAEMLDRFGPLPETGENLLRQQKLRLRAIRAGITRIEASDKGGTLRFAAQTRVEPAGLIRLIQAFPSEFRLEGTHALRFSKTLAESTARFEYIESLLARLGV